MLALALVALGLAVGATTASAADGDIGYEGGSYTGAAYSATSDKPQSKLWHAGGTWFATMFEQASKSWHIFQLDRKSHLWLDTGVQIDDRAGTLSDALWDGTHLYIASHVVTVSTDATVRVSKPDSPARLYRFSYSPDTETFTPDAGFPVTITENSSESMTIDKDSTGRIWATWTQVSGTAETGYVNEVYVNATTGRDNARWGTPFVVPVEGARVAPDDISAIVAFRNRVGVLWSNQNDDAVHWAVHADGADLNSWSGRVATQGPGESDDHVSIKTVLSDSAGRVYAAIKTGADTLPSPKATDASIKLLTFTPGGGVATAVVSTVADCQTRPMVMLDETNQRVHVFATGPSTAGCAYSGVSGSIYHKSASMDAPQFDPGRGTPVIQDADSASVNDVTSTKQSVTAASGLVVLAANTKTQRYWHAEISLRDNTPSPAAPEASFTSSVVEGIAPLSVQFTDTSTGEPTAWSWDFGDGTLSTEQNPTHVFTTAGTYTVTLAATNAAGASSPVTHTVTVTPTPEPTPVPTPKPPAGGGSTPSPAPAPAPTPTPPTDRAGSWFYLNDRNTGEANVVLAYGDPSDVVLVADTDGRNGDSLLVRRGNQYFVRNALSTGVAEYTFAYGDAGDAVLVGDWNGDRQDTLVVRRGNTYFVKNSTTTGVADSVFVYGDPGDTVLVGDWDGDGVDTLAVKRGNTYFIRNSLSSGVADRVITYGDPGDSVLVGRWNGKTAGLAVQRGNVFYLKNELTTGVADVVFGYGNPGDFVLVGDWNGDCVDSLGVRWIG